MGTRCMMVFAAASMLAVGVEGQRNAVELEQVTALTFREGKMSAAGRTSAVPQLKCVGGSAMSHTEFHPSVVQCKNAGYDGVDVQWECTADLDDSVRFGATEVFCEGYEYPEDPYILRGSCGLEYSLELTAAGRADRKAHSQGSSRYSSDYSSDYSSYEAPPLEIDAAELRARISLLDDEIDQLSADLSTKLAERRTASDRLLTLLVGAGASMDPEPAKSPGYRESAPLPSHGLDRQQVQQMNEWFPSSAPPELSNCTIERRRGCQHQKNGDDACLTPQEFETSFAGQKPVLISGLIDEWPAHERWAQSKVGFLERYGNVTCQVMSAQEFVLSGPAKLAVPIQLHNITSLGHPDLFVFDSMGVFQQRADDGSSILNDFFTPPLWPGLAAIGPENGTAGQPDRWNMLSYGAHEAGLGWHAHGPSWLGIVQGTKRWLVFPPGGSKSFKTQGHPFDSARHYVKEVLPGLSPEERPLDCVQQPGELLYLPGGWPHLTLNDGEVIGAGAQAILSSNDLENIRRGAEVSEVSALTGFAMLVQQEEIARSLGLESEAAAGAEAISLLERAMHWHPHEQKATIRLASLMLRNQDYSRAAQLLVQMRAGLLDLAKQILQGEQLTSRVMVIARSMWQCAQGMRVPVLASHLVPLLDRKNVSNPRTLLRLLLLAHHCDGLAATKFNLTCCLPQHTVPNIPSQLEGLSEEHYGTLYAYQLVVEGLSLLQQDSSTPTWLARGMAWDIHLLAMELASSLAEDTVDGAWDAVLLKHAHDCVTANPLATKCAHVVEQQTKKQTERKKKKDKRGKRRKGEL